MPLPPTKSAQHDLRRPEPRTHIPSRSAQAPHVEMKKGAGYIYSRTPLPIDTRMPGQKSSERKKLDPRTRAEASDNGKPRFTDAFGGTRR